MSMSTRSHHANSGPILPNDTIIIGGAIGGTLTAFVIIGVIVVFVTRKCKPQQPEAEANSNDPLVDYLLPAADGLGAFPNKRKQYCRYDQKPLLNPRIYREPEPDFAEASEVIILVQR